jgi:hypothetical protein
MSDYTVREANLGDADEYRFVVKSWIDTYRSANASGMLSLSPLYVPCTNCNAPQAYDYATVMVHTIERLLKRPGLFVLVATNPKGAAQCNLHGFICYELGANVPTYRPPDYKLEVRVSAEPLVHYILVKKLYRQRGMARALMASAGINPNQPFLHTCHTPSFKMLQRAGKCDGAMWAPQSARFAKDNYAQASGTPPVQLPGAKPASRQRPKRDDEGRG